MASVVDKGDRVRTIAESGCRLHADSATLAPRVIGQSMRHNLPRCIVEVGWNGLDVAEIPGVD